MLLTCWRRYSSAAMYFDTTSVNLKQVKEEFSPTSKETSEKKDQYSTEKEEPEQDVCTPVLEVTRYT